MASRRKDMWKLLYNLVNRNETNLNDVFNFVDDILCKEPSLIRCYLANEPSAKFQDTFIIWLINKFLKCMNDDESITSELLRRKNVKLQQKILDACLGNHPKLFPLLIKEYIEALQQIVSQLSKLSYYEEDACDDIKLTLQVFKRDAACMWEVDPNCDFHVIEMSLCTVDARLRDLIVVLQHALNVGYIFHPDIFIASMLIVLQVLRESDVATKFACLNYCYRVLQLSNTTFRSESRSQLAHCLSVSLLGLLAMWKVVPDWLRENCISANVVLELVRITCDWFELLPQYAHNYFQTCCEVLAYMAECKQTRAQSDSWHALATSLLNYAVSRNDMFNVTISYVNLLVRISRQQPSLLSLLAVLHVNVKERPGKTADDILAHILGWLKQLLQNKLHKHTVYTQLTEILTALKYLEHYAYQRQQLSYLQQYPEPTLATFYQQQSFGLQPDILAQARDLDWDMLVQQYFETAPVALKKQRLTIASLWLQTVSLRQALKPPTLQMLIAQVEQPLKQAMLAGRNVPLDSEERELLLLCIRLLCHITPDSDTSATTLQQLYTGVCVPILSCSDTLLRRELCAHLPFLYVAGYVRMPQLVTAALSEAVSKDKETIAAVLRVLICGRDVTTAYTYKCVTHATQYTERVVIDCSHCTESSMSNVQELRAYLKEHNAIWLPWSKALAQQSPPQFPQELLNLMCTAIVRNKEFGFATHHLDLLCVQRAELRLLTEPIDALLKMNLADLARLLPMLAARNASFLDNLSQRLLDGVLTMLNKPLEQQSVAEQRRVLQLIKCCAYVGISEEWLFFYFKLCFFFLLHPHSLVAQETVLYATELCAKNGLLPITLWNWYKRDAIALMVHLALHVYLTKGVRLSRSLRAFSKMLGFSCVQELICKYHRLLTTMILPYCIRQPRCKGAIVLISRLTRKPIPTLFAASFLRIYTHICLTEEADIGNKCIELIVRCTASSFQRLMNSDVKQTVSEILIYFNRNPNFVMRSFQCLLLQPHESVDHNVPASALQTRANARSTEFAKFIADRFLGVITHFESCLAEPNFEKPLKAEALYSLGQIMRFVGSSYVTQFRFKIIAMLSFVGSLNDPKLQRICLRIWHIFLHVVNLQELGPSLSCIVAQLQPLLSHSAAEVNAIYEFVILKNASMLGPYISDLYFLEMESEITPAIRQCITRQSELLHSSNSTFAEKLGFLYKQITNDNLQVRIYGLKYLTAFFAAQRAHLNELVLNDVLIAADTVMESTINVLIDGCQHENRNLRLASAKCLGELGAIDASYMPSNYKFKPPSSLPLSILTDDFAVMALNELCRAYQSQKDTKYVDNFSLAIQETLAVCGISPKENKKRALWESMPERMRQIMEPLLESCYTGSRRDSSCKEHPLFGSHYCKTYADWAFVWAGRLIDCVQAADTKHLLVSYKPSVKRDNITMSIFFPYILLHALQECDAAQATQIFEECCTVFTNCANESAPGNSNGGSVKQDTGNCSGKANRSSFKEFKSSKYTADYVHKSEGGAGAGGGGAGDGGQLKPDTVNMSEELLFNQARTATKLCSEQIDFLQRWLREYQRHNAAVLAPRGAVTSADATTDGFKRVQQFVERFDRLLVSRANYNCGEYARALMYIEDYIEAAPAERLVEQFTFLINIYGRLMDTDSVEGAVHVRTYDLNISQEILVNRFIDRHQQDVISCYEQLLASDEPLHTDHIRGIIDAYLRMDTPKTALLITDGLWQRLADQYSDDYFKECRAELLWRLGSYDDLQEVLGDSGMRRHSNNFHIQCAEACLHFRNPQQDMTQFSTQLDDIRCNVLESMRTCSAMRQNMYAHSYDEVLKLHMLHELEQYKACVDRVSQALVSVDTGQQSKCVEELQSFFGNWQARLDVLQPSVRVLEPIFGFRCNLLTESRHMLRQAQCGHAASTDLLQQVTEQIDTQLGGLWLTCAQINRDVGNLQRAHLAIMKAAVHKPQTLFIEKAKLLWQKGDQTLALKLIEEHIDAVKAKCSGVSIRKLPPKERALFGEAKYLQATYNAESMNICSELNLRYFKDAIGSNIDSEKCYVQTAQYMEKMYESLIEAQKDDANGRELLVNIMLNYAKSLRCGCENVYQSLPRLVSLWLDTTSRCLTICEQPGKSTAQSAGRVPGLQELSRKANDIMNNCSNALPIAVFYTAFSQLLSRICHPSSDVFNVLRTIIIRLIENYPQQSLWMLLPIIKSAVTSRVKRCKLIFTDARLDVPSFKKLLTDFNLLTERLIELTNKEVALDRPHVLSDLVKQMPKLFMNPDFSEIMLPFEKYMQPSFPIGSTSLASNIRFNRTGESANESASLQVPRNLFLHQEIYIRGFREEITVLRSAARPKKITIRCSDGCDYDVMVKPKDDLRKDFRLMEFNGLVKRFLHQDQQARHRRLCIRTYAAIPFNEECGLVEWLPHLNPFRGICNSIYRPRGLGISDRQLRSYAVPANESIERKRSIFIEKLLPNHPAVFQEWFRHRFPTPHTWYEARSSYVRTVAVMSIVGYILGLGDRHGENLLFDEYTGDAVHVDFNCLFNRGELFAYPEMVPFRLTHNMVAAMGPLGIEGAYRKCCEITLRILKHESKTLNSILRPFVYDTVVLNRNYPSSSNAGELTDPKATADVRRIAERLRGHVMKNQANGIPLSIEGQVNFLITEASSIDNLAAMYIGWGAYV